MFINSPIFIKHDFYDSKNGCFHDREKRISVCLHYLVALKSAAPLNKLLC